MRMTFCLLCCLAALVGAAQNWCPPGATWWHRYCAGEINLQAIVKTTGVGDTLVQGEQARLALAEVIGFDTGTGQTIQHGIGPIITKSNGARVSNWDGFGWRLLFDLDASPGEQWELELGSLDAITATVSDTGVIAVDGLLLRYSTVNFSPALPGLESDSIIERIGYLKLYLNPLYVLGPIPPYCADLLRCYEDNDVSYSMVGTAACEPILGATTQQAPAGPTLVPNPGSDFVQLSNDGPSPLVVMIRDVQGACVARATLHGQQQLGVEGLPAGLYAVSVLMPDGRHRAHRWLKQ